jgi:hypothetical protein
VTAPRTSLRLRVVPGTSRSGIVGRYGDAWKLRVTAPAEEGKANDAVIALLAETLDLPRRDVAITVGQASRDKIVTFSGLSLDAAEARLSAAAGATT